MTGASTESVLRDGAYDVTVTGFLHDEELNSPVIIDCELTIPETSYVRRKLMHYYPGIRLNYTSTLHNVKHIISKIMYLLLYYFQLTST